MFDAANFDRKKISFLLKKKHFLKLRIILIKQDALLLLFNIQAFSFTMKKIKLRSDNKSNNKNKCNTILKDAI